MAEEGLAHGIQTPTVEEREATMGLKGYLPSLSLTERQTYDALGNAFDPAALRLMIGATA